MIDRYRGSSHSCEMSAPDSLGSLDISSVAAWLDYVYSPWHESQVKISRTPPLSIPPSSRSFAYLYGVFYNIHIHTHCTCIANSFDAVYLVLQINGLPTHRVPITFALGRIVWPTTNGETS